MTQAVLLVVVIGLLLAAALAVGVLFSTRKTRLRGWVEGFFRRPVKSPKTVDRDHYYKPYWQSR
jgi:hypothetical protein